jgi:hypothetical protein
MEMVHAVRKMFVTRWFARLKFAMLAGVALGAVGAARGADTFMKPTAEELAMKSLPGYPGAPAVVLFKEEITKDDLHVVLHYERIKILTEEGKKYANVELGFVSTTDANGYTGDDKMVGDIMARTIHPDGTVIPFTGKPYLKVIEKEQGAKFQEKVFTLPEVEVGSIIEYRYSTRYNDLVYESPTWIIQGELFLKAAHFQWYPTTKELVDGETEQPINAISWFPVLPEGAKIETTQLPGTGPTQQPQSIYNLNVKDVPPMAHEEFMPPISSFSYRVAFAFTPYRTGAEFWKANGKSWSSRVNKMAEPNGDLRTAVQPIIAGATTDDAKLRKIYAAVMALENTSYTRAHEEREDKAAGLGPVKSAADVLARKRGTPRQLTQLFVAMARASGMKAYLMLVPDRSENLFVPTRLSMNQFGGTIAIVNVDGKEQYFDPGERYCEYGHLAWEHTFVSGLRQVDGGTDIGHTPGDVYTTNKFNRVANLDMDEHGEIKGKIDLSFTGSQALRWRHVALRGDEESLRHALRTDLERMVPKSLDVKVTDIKNLDSYEQPLMVTYSVKGVLSSFTGKRMVLPADLFTAGETAAFPHEKREVAVYFPYPQAVNDAVRVNFPDKLTVEAAPAAGKLNLQSSGAYALTVTPAAGNFVTRRTYLFGDVVVPVAQYSALRTFYSQFETKDQESVILTPVAATATSSPTGN